MFIPIILGTAREGRQSEKVAKFMIKEVEKAGLDTELIDVKDYRVEATTKDKDNPKVAKWSKIMERADGYIIVTPEYNHGYPGELKMALDMAWEEYEKKPAGVCGVSMGTLGGARVVEQLNLVLRELKMVPIRNSLYFSNVTTLFNEKGNIKDDSHYKFTEEFLSQLKWFADTLKKNRENKG